MPRRKKGLGGSRRQRSGTMQDGKRDNRVPAAAHHIPVTAAHSQRSTGPEPKMMDGECTSEKVHPCHSFSARNRKRCPAQFSFCRCRNSTASFAPSAPLAHDGNGGASAATARTGRAMAGSFLPAAILPGAQSERRFPGQVLE